LSSKHRHARKSPVRHTVRAFTREDGSYVRSHIRGRGVKATTETKPGIPAYLGNKQLTERELNLLKLRLNSGRLDIHDVDIPDGGWELTPDQNKKGFDWLYNLYKSPTGKERVNTPFGYRESSVLENFNKIKLTDYRDTANYYQAQAKIKNYVPVYTVYAKDGHTFEYSVHGGAIDISG